MKQIIAKGLGAVLAIGFAMPASAQALFDGCPSDQIMAKFAEFGRTGQGERQGSDVHFNSFLLRYQKRPQSTFILSPVMAELRSLAK